MAPGRSGSIPARNIAELAREKGIEVVTEYFTPELARQIREEHGPAKIVVSTNTFHHIGDLDPFTLGVTLLLDDDGVFVVEVPHALELVEQNEFDGVYHEHVSQHTVKSFVDHFRLFGLEVFDVERLDIHGGSIRVFARRSTNGAAPAPVVDEWLDEEARRGLFVAATYDAFRDRVERIRAELLKILGELKADGKRIVGYGASARGNTLLNYYGIGPETLDYIVDRNPLKTGLYSPGMHIPVEGPERLAAGRSRLRARDRLELRRGDRSTAGRTIWSGVDASSSRSRSRESSADALRARASSSIRSSRARRPVGRLDHLEHVARLPPARRRLLAASNAAMIPRDSSRVACIAGVARVAGERLAGQAPLDPGQPALAEVDPDAGPLGALLASCSSARPPCDARSDARSQSARTST